MPSATTNNQLSFKPLHDTFAAEVEGMEWTLPIKESLLDEIKAGADQYGVLVFRNANLNNDEHIRFTKQLGECMDVKAHIKAGRLMRFPETPEIFDVSNLDDKDQIVTAADPARSEGNKGNFIWHADMTYDPQRAKYSILRAVELPPAGTGGETMYLDSRTAYADLPQSTKDELEDLVTHNSLFHNRKLAAPEFFAKIEPMDYPMAKYKLVYPHEGSGRKNLYLTTYAHHLEGKTQEESQVVFDKLWDHLIQDKYIVRYAIFTHHNDLTYF
jgi:alpha-ketoglutarate-dependent 2,4-dichlorophenoxyacetate dioxygenase